MTIGIFKEWLVKYFFVDKIVVKAILVFYSRTASVTGELQSQVTCYQCSFQQTYLVKPPQILQPVTLLMFRVEAIPMFLLTVPIQICQVKLVLCDRRAPKSSPSHVTFASFLMKNDVQSFA
jgi:hypothetical protein